MVLRVEAPQPAEPNHAVRTVQRTVQRLDVTGSVRATARPAEPARGRWHATRSDEKQMSARFKRTAQPYYGFDSVTTLRQSEQAPLPFSLRSCQQRAACFTDSQKQHRPSNKVSKERGCSALLHLVPKICKALNRKVVPSPHTEAPLFRFLG